MIARAGQLRAARGALDDPLRLRAYPRAAVEGRRRRARPPRLPAPLARTHSSGHGPRATGHGPRTTGHGPRTTGHGATGHGPRATGQKPRIFWYNHHFPRQRRVPERALGSTLHPQLLHHRPHRPRQSRTLADRLLERTGALSSREMMAQVLDSMDLERERGITIKAHTGDGCTPAPPTARSTSSTSSTPRPRRLLLRGVALSRRLRGALLVVDASQGVEAQTLANAYLASDQGLELIPVLNKIDLPAAEPERVKEQIEQVIGLDNRRRARHLGQDGIGVDNGARGVDRAGPPAGRRS